MLTYTKKIKMPNWVFYLLFTPICKKKLKSYVSLEIVEFETVKDRSLLIMQQSNELIMETCVHCVEMYRVHNCFGMGPMCKICTWYAEYRQCRCGVFLVENAPTLVETHIAPLLLPKAISVEIPAWGHGPPRLEASATWLPEDLYPVQINLSPLTENIDYYNSVVTLRSLRETAHRVALDVLN